eukprot:scpid81670/ scgid22653/ Glyoxylate reductase/hydroxypyruvate reductase
MAALFARISAPFYSRTVFARAMSEAKVLVTRQVPDSFIAPLLQETSIKVIPGGRDAMPKQKLHEMVRGVDGILCTLCDRIDESVLRAAGSSLKVVSTMSVGYNHIDVEACKKQNVAVGYTPDVLTDATAELAVALLLATSRRLFEGALSLRMGQWGSWDPTYMLGKGLKGSTVGVMGMGRIGQAVAKRLLPFGVEKMLYSGRAAKPEIDYADFVSFEQLLERSDFIVVTCALTAETTNLFSSEQFSTMKNTAVFVNVARGEVVDQAALVQALKSNQIAAAGLDVMTPEPIPTNHELVQLSNCVLVPHIGSAEEQTRLMMGQLAAKNIVAALKQESLPTPVPGT